MERTTDIGKVVGVGYTILLRKRRRGVESRVTERYTGGRGSAMPANWRYIMGEWSLLIIYK